MIRSILKLPRRSVLKAIIGALIIFFTLSMLSLEVDLFGVFNIPLIIIGGILMKDYFREIGFNS